MGGDRSKQFDNERLVAAQAARLLRAGLLLEELDLLEILELLKLRKPELAGMAKQTCSRWRQKYAGDVAIAAQMLRQWVEIYRPSDAVLATLVRYGSETDDTAMSLRLPMSLWAGVSPDHTNIVLAEMEILARGHQRAGRHQIAMKVRALVKAIHDAWQKRLDDFPAEFLQIRMRVRQHELNLESDPEARYIDGGPAILHTASSATTDPFRYRQRTEELRILAFDGDPSAVEALIDATPSIEEIAELSVRNAGKAALIERAVLALSEAPRTASGEPRSFHRARIAEHSKLIERFLPMLGPPEGMGTGLSGHASSAWTTEDWETLKLSANAAARALNITSPFAPLRRAQQSADLSQRRVRLLSLAPWIADQLTKGRSPDAGVIQALGGEVMVDVAWAMPPARREQWLAVVTRAATVKGRGTADQEGQRAVRSLLELARVLRYEKRTLGLDVHEELNRAMFLIQGLMSATEDTEQPLAEPGLRLRR